MIQRSLYCCCAMNDVNKQDVHYEVSSRGQSVETMVEIQMVDHDCVCGGQIAETVIYDECHHLLMAL